MTERNHWDGQAQAPLLPALATNSTPATTWITQESFFRHLGKFKIAKVVVNLMGHVCCEFEEQIATSQRRKLRCHRRGELKNVLDSLSVASWGQVVGTSSPSVLQ